MATVTRVRDYQVLVGSAEGNILSLTETELVFRPPSKEPPPRVNEEEFFIRVSNYFFFLNLLIQNLFLNRIMKENNGILLCLFYTIR